MKMKITAFVRKANGHSFSCVADVMVSKCLLAGYGKTAQEAVKDFYTSYNELRQMDGDKVPEIEVTLKFDVGSLFSYFSYLNIEGIAVRSGINPSVMRQYASGARVPKKERLQIIEQKMIDISKEIQCVKLFA